MLRLYHFRLPRAYQYYVYRLQCYVSGAGKQSQRLALDESEDGIDRGRSFETDSFLWRTASLCGVDDIVVAECAPYVFKKEVNGGARTNSARIDSLAAAKADDVE